MDLKNDITLARRTRKRPRRTIINIPTAADRYGRHGRATAPSPPVPPPATARPSKRRIVVDYDDDDGSVSSRFSQCDLSTDGNASDVARGKGRGRHNVGHSDEMARRRERERREHDRRERTKGLLAESQRTRDDQYRRSDYENRDVIDLDESASVRGRVDRGSSFDGVRTDGFANPKMARYVVDVVRRLGTGGSDDDDDEDGYGHMKNDDNRRTKDGKRNYRGKKHAGSAMAGQSSLSSSLLSPAKNGGWRMLRERGGRRDGRDRDGDTGSSRPIVDVFSASSSATAHGEDPLDAARSQQEVDRCPPLSSTPSAFRDFLDTTPQKVKKIFSQTMGSALDKVLQLGGGSMTTNRSRNAEAASERCSHPPMEEGRRSNADTALEQKTRNVVGGRQGGKRKTMHHPDSLEVVRCPRNESRFAAIAVDDSIDRNSDESDKDDYDLDKTIAACGRRLNSEEIPTKSTPPDATVSNFGVRRHPEKNGSHIKSDSSGSKNRRIDDIHSHLRGTKRDDEIESFQSTECSSTRETKSTMRNPDRLISRKAEFDYGNEFRHNSTQRRGKPAYGLTNQMKKQGMLTNCDDSDQWISTSNHPKTQTTKYSRLRKGSSTSPQITSCATTRKTRSSSKANAVDGGVITIDSSSDEGDDTSIDDSNNTSNDVSESSQVASERRASLRSTRAVGDLASIDAVRIAIGKKIVKSKCSLGFQFGTPQPYIQFSFEDRGNMSEHRVYLRSSDELKEVKYHIADDNATSEGDDIDDSMTVIAFRITPTDKNNFIKYTSSYDQEESDQITGKQYISVEFRDNDDFRAMLDQMRQHSDLGVWCTKESEMEFHELEKYTKALLDDNRKEKTARLSIARNTRSGGNKKKDDADNKLLLVYPFDCAEAELSAAASGLKELGGDLLGLDGAEVSAQSQLDGDPVAEDIKKSSRTHYVTIREDDKERLCPGQFLNDTLVDFWMRWISRGESKQSQSNVHFFTSHFMTTLKEKGPKAVASWTGKKNINLFQKKLVFIPVNADLHWSLCVVVNPGKVTNWFDADTGTDEEHSFILFLDSLNMHSKYTYARHIRSWLNCEWKRLGHEKVGRKGDHFDTSSLPLVSPKIPYQDNGCDCGVFVCRYAYSLYTMRHQRFTNADYYEKPRFASLITRGPAFQFDMADIDRIRNEISTLIDNLSVLYLRGLKKQLEAARVAKRRAKQKESSDDVSNDVPDDKDEASVETEGDGKVILSSFEEKENIQQELGSLNSVLFAAPEKSSCEGFSDDALSLSLALTHLEPSYTYENYSDDPVEEGIVSETI